MQPWQARRDSKEDPTFRPSLDRLNIDVQVWDDIAIDIETVLCGLTDTVLDLVYPPLVEDLRVYLIPAMRSLPALRVAFRVDEQGHIVYVAVDRRDVVLAGL